MCCGGGTLPHRMTVNGQHHPSRPRIELRQAAASQEEAAAISAAIQQFLRDTAPAPAPAETTINPWLRAGLMDATGRDPLSPSPWGSQA
jgi:hypothetical protein